MYLVPGQRGRRTCAQEIFKPLQRPAALLPGRCPARRCGHPWSGEAGGRVMRLGRGAGPAGFIYFQGWGQRGRVPGLWAPTHRCQKSQRHAGTHLPALSSLLPARQALTRPCVPVQGVQRVHTVGLGHDGSWSSGPRGSPTRALPCSNSCSFTFSSLQKKKSECKAEEKIETSVTPEACERAPALRSVWGTRE